MKGPYPGWDKDLHFVRSDDLFDTKHQKLAACGNQFEIVAHRVRLIASVPSKHQPLVSENQMTSLHARHAKKGFRQTLGCCYCSLP